MSSLGVLRSLELLLADQCLLRNTPFDTPMASDSLRRLLSPDSDSPLVPLQLPHAQRIAGTIGFIVSTTRPDAYFAYCVVSRFLGESTLTEYAYRCLLRVAFYLVSTKTLFLTYHPLPPGASRQDLLRAYCDSSHGNAGKGLSYGGFVVLSVAGGAIAWKCIIPKAGDDSPGASELRIAVRAYKCILALRSLLLDLGIGLHQLHPTPLFTDFQSVSEGISAEKIGKNSRWMASRYAMIVWGVLCLSILLCSTPSSGNVSDILTKALVGEPFFRHRATLLGHL